MQFPDTVTIKVQKRVSARKTITVEEQHPARFYGPLAVRCEREASTHHKASYNVTHRATGLRVVADCTLQQAIRIAKDLQDLPEWAEPTLGEGRTIGNSHVFDKLAEAVRKAKWVHDADADYNLRRKWRI
jgi:hypothetical protein